MAGSVLEDTMKRLGTFIGDALLIGFCSVLVMTVVLWLMKDFFISEYDEATGVPMFFLSISVTAIVAGLTTISRTRRLEQCERELELAHKLIKDIGGAVVHATLRVRAREVQEAYVAYNKELQGQSNADEPHPESDALKNLRRKHRSLLARFKERHESARLAGIPVYSTVADTLSNESLVRDSPQTAEEFDDALAEVIEEAVRP